MPQKKKRKTYNRLILFIVMFLSIIIYIVMETNSLRFIHTSVTSVAINQFVEVTGPIRYDHNSNAIIYSDNTSGFYICTKDGVRFFSTSGELRWESVFSMSQPIMATNRQFIAVAEYRGRSLHVYNSISGEQYVKEFDHPILSFSVNTRGFSSVILARDDAYVIQVFDSIGNVPFNMNYPTTNIFPIATAISNDNRILAISYLDITANMTSQITYSYINKSEDRGISSDGMFAGTEHKNQIVGILNFIDSNSLIAISDSEISNIDVELAEKRWTYEFDNELDKFGLLNDRTFALALGKPILNRDAEPLGTVKIYNTNLDEMGAFSLGKTVTYMSTGHNSSIVGSGRVYSALNRSGKLLWEYHATTDLKEVMFLNNTDNILIATNTEAQILRRVRTRNRDNLQDLGDNLDSLQDFDLENLSDLDESQDFNFEDFEDYHDLENQEIELEDEFAGLEELEYPEELPEFENETSENIGDQI